MRFAFALVLVFGIVSVCSFASGDEFPREKLDDTGFVTIFDGKSLDGWHVSAETGHSGTSGHKSGGRWVVENGAITGSQDIPGNGGIVITDAQYGDFEVLVEMNNDFGPDSGLFLRSNDKGQAYQYLVDYHSDGNVAGLYGEGTEPGLSLPQLRFHRQTEPDQAARRLSHAAADQSRGLAKVLEAWRVASVPRSDRRQPAPHYHLDQQR